MKFNTVIIGGGLSGLAAGIELAKAGKSVAIVSAGQSTLHFHSGSFDLLGYDTSGHVVVNPIAGIKALAPSHPYSKVGDVLPLAKTAKDMLTQAGITTTGDPEKNHYRITPMGIAKPAWLTIDDYITATDPKTLQYNKVLLV